MERYQLPAFAGPNWDSLINSSNRTHKILLYEHTLSGTICIIKMLYCAELHVQVKLIIIQQLCVSNVTICLSQR